MGKHEFHNIHFLKLSGRPLVVYQLDVTVFRLTSLMTLANPVYLRTSKEKSNTARITFFFTRCFSTIVSLG